MDGWSPKCLATLDGGLKATITSGTQHYSKTLDVDDQLSFTLDPKKDYFLYFAITGSAEPRTSSISSAIWAYEIEMDLTHLSLTFVDSEYAK